MMLYAPFRIEFKIPIQFSMCCVNRTKEVKFKKMKIYVQAKRQRP